VIGGFLALDDGELADRLAYLQNAIGAVGSPFDNYLTLRGLKTLAVRMDRHCSSARAVVEFLAKRSEVIEIRYPGLPDHPGHDVAARQMKDFGGMVSFRVSGGMGAATRLAASTRVFSLAESLGAVESLIEHPGAMTHASVAGSPLEVPDDLIRLSIGIETLDDLLGDLSEAFDRL
jgi:cystathionine gamma-synthase